MMPGVPISEPTVSIRSSRLRITILWIMVIVVTIGALWAGVAWRGWWFRMTAPIHFADIERNWTWGQYTFANIHDKDRSFLDTYDDVGIQDRKAGIWLDYAPARLLVNTCWVAWNYQSMPYEWHQSYRRTRGDIPRVEAFNAFYLRFNMIMEALAAAGAFMLVRNVVRSAGFSNTRAMILAMAAGLLLWFNPAMIHSAHGWPSGDMWILPPFLWAVYLGRINRWFTAGVILAIGALFKGQIAFAIPVFILWPLFQLRWIAPLRLIAGLIGTFGLLTAGWTLTYVDANHLRHLSAGAIFVTILPVVLLVVFLLLRSRYPVLYSAHIPTLVLACFGTTGALAFISMWTFDTSYAWFDASYRFGAEHWPHMIMGHTSNLPGIMTLRYGWSNQTGPAEILFYLDTAHAYPVTLQAFLFGIFVFLLVLSSFGIAMHDWRNSTRFLIAIVTPWLLFFTIPCQIHERYLLFAAASACVCIGHSVRMALLGMFCTVLTWMMTMSVMLSTGQLREWNALLYQNYPTWFSAPGPNGFAQTLRRHIAATHPDIGWAVILTLLIFLYYTLMPARRTRLVSYASTVAEPQSASIAAASQLPSSAMPDSANVSSHA